MTLQLTTANLQARLTLQYSAVTKKHAFILSFLQT